MCEHILSITLLIMLLLLLSAFLAMVMAIGLLTSRLLNGRPLLDARIVTLPFQFRIRREGQDSLHGFTNLEDALALRASPNAEDVLTISHTENSAAHLLTGLAELVSDDSEEQILPVPVRNTLPQSYNPLPAVLIHIILPYWTNALLKQVVVGHLR